jgi:hypothetical protein
MSLILSQKFFSGNSQHCLALRNDEYVRPLTVGSGWTRLRIGLLMAFDANATISAADFCFGLCNHPYGMLSWNCPNYLGFGFGPAGAYSLAYIAGSGNPYFQSAAYYRYRKGSISTHIAGNGNPNYTAATSGSLSRRSIWIVDITKGSPNYTVSAFGSLSASLVVLDFTYENLLEAVAQYSAAPRVGSVSLSACSAGPQAGAFNESTGVLNALAISWTRFDVAVEIYGVAVYRVY